jgi:long-chain acyl-CoA synthetase
MTQMPSTLPQLFHQRIAESSANDALFVRREGHYVGTSWRALAADVLSVASALIKLGVRPGDRVAQFSENRHEWIVVDLAIQLAQAVHVPIHAPLTGEQAAYQIDHSGARVVFLSTPAQADKLANLPRAWSSDLRFYSFEYYSRQIGRESLEDLAWRDK